MCQDCKFPLIVRIATWFLLTGDNVDIDQLGMGAMDRQPRHFHQQQVPPAAQEGVNPAGENHNGVLSMPC